MSPVRAVQCTSFGPFDQLALVDLPSPPLGERQVRIEVGACGVNFVDGLLVRGTYQIRPPVPFVPGMEVVGHVVELGAAVRDDPAALTEGARVLANVGLGGYASEVVVSVDRVLPVPDALSDGQAATFMQSYLTGWFGLRVRGDVRRGETLGVLGAGGGVGAAAVDVASSLGLQVVGAASTAAKRQLALDRGAVAVIDSGKLTAEEVKNALRAFGQANGGNGGLDHLYDPVGGELATTCLRSLGEGGQHLVVGFVAGIPALPANQVLLRNRRVTGVDWGAWATAHPEENRRLLGEVLDGIDRGQLRPVEPEAYPLAAAGQVLTDLAERRLTGKAVLVP